MDEKKEYPNRAKTEISKFKQTFSRYTGKDSNTWRAKHRPIPQEIREIYEFCKGFNTKELDVLNERSKGVSEGMMKDEFNKRYPEILEQWRFELDPRPEGGENFEDVEKRVVPIIEFHVKEHAGENILYVSHGNVIRVVLGYILNVPFGLRARIKQDYCAFNAVSFDHEKSRWNIEFINQVFHK